MTVVRISDILQNTMEGKRGEGNTYSVEGHWDDPVQVIKGACSG